VFLCCRSHESSAADDTVIHTSQSAAADYTNDSFDYSSTTATAATTVATETSAPARPPAPAAAAASVSGTGATRSSQSPSPKRGVKAVAGKEGKSPGNVRSESESDESFSINASGEMMRFVLHQYLPLTSESLPHLPSPIPIF
jgi:hypothetical protein